MDLYSELSWRGLIYDTTEGLPELLKGGSLTTYIGFDPTDRKSTRLNSSHT